MILLIILSSFIYNLSSCQSNQLYNSTAKLASKNIIYQLHPSIKDEFVLVNSGNKDCLTECLISELKASHYSFYHFKLNLNQDSLKTLLSMINEKTIKRYFIFLIDPSDASFLFENIGRPDMGLKIPEKYLFCDWLMPEEQIIRLLSFDVTENNIYQTNVKSLLNTTDTIYIYTDAGTNIKFIARNWIIDKGEIYCTPIERETNGVILVDGCAYWAPPSKPVKLDVFRGKVININSLSESDKQEKLIKTDLSADENASVLSEVGIGTNKNARWNSDIMESEQSRTTCHFGFGMNLNYGGDIYSKKHFDLVILNPTIVINNMIIYEKGLLKTE